MILENLINHENFITKPLSILKKGEKTVIVQKYIEGTTIDKCEIKHTIETFKKLARLNIKNKAHSNLSSMYLDGKKFNSIHELIDHESLFYTENYEGRHNKKQLMKYLEFLKEGFGCVILEDMNNGNVIVDENSNETFLIDYDYLIYGNNLYQLEFLDPYLMQESSWYNIQKDANLVLKSYFDELGVSSTSANNQINPFEILKQLRSIYYLMWKKENIKYKQFDTNIESIWNNKVL